MNSPERNPNNRPFNQFRDSLDASRNHVLKHYGILFGRLQDGFLLPAQAHIDNPRIFHETIHDAKMDFNDGIDFGKTLKKHIGTNPSVMAFYMKCMTTYIPLVTKSLDDLCANQEPDQAKFDLLFRKVEDIIASCESIAITLIQQKSAQQVARQLRMTPTYSICAEFQKRVERLEAAE